MDFTYLKWLHSLKVIFCFFSLELEITNAISHIMMFKISFFLTLALALSSLNAVTAVSVPRQEDDGGEGVLRFTDLSAPEP